MKNFKIIIGLILLLISTSIYGQKIGRIIEWENEILKDENLSDKEYKNDIIKYDFAPLWTKTENSAVYGFIGDNYQRLYMKIISVRKDRKRPDTYHISGKSMVKNNICDFSGTIMVTNSRIYKDMHWGVDDEYKNDGIKKQGITIARYNFQETKSQKNSGIFEGVLYTLWFIDNNEKIQYDNIRFESDDYRNNQFVGTWKSYRSNVVKTANWGDYRISRSGDLDGGAGEFSPIDKYLKFGWQNYRDAYFNNNNEQAKQKEKREWWK